MESHKLPSKHAAQQAEEQSITHQTANQKQKQHEKETVTLSEYLTNRMIGIFTCRSRLNKFRNEIHKPRIRNKQTLQFNKQEVKEVIVN
jgi:hypothetical protein